MPPSRVLPQRPPAHVTGDAAVSTFAAACDASWIIAPVHKEHDYGLDLRIEVARGGYVTGEEFLVQVKGRGIVDQTGGLLPQAKVSQSTINYWLAKLQPVMIVVVDLSSKDVYYDWLEHSYADYPNPRESQREVALPLRFANAEHSIHKEVAAYLARYYASLSSDMARLSKGTYLASLLFSVSALHRLTSRAAIELQRIEPERPEHVKQVLDQFCFEFVAHDSLLSGLRSGAFGHRPVSSRFFNKVETRLTQYESLREKLIEYKGETPGGDLLCRPLYGAFGAHLLPLNEELADLQEMLGLAQVLNRLPTHTSFDEGDASQETST
jgi:hypothetical protein